MTPIQSKNKMVAWLALFFVMVSGFGVRALAQESSSAAWIQNLESLGAVKEYKDWKSQIKKKGWKFTPFFKTRMDYTSNVFFAQHGKDDVIWYETPGFFTNYNGDHADFNLGYKADFDYFSKYSNQNAQNQDFFANEMYRINKNWYVKAGENLRQYSAVSGDALQKPLDTFENTVTTALGYIQGKWTFESSYEYFLRNFQSALADRYDMHQHKFNELVYYRLNDNWRFFSGYRMGFIDYDSMPTHDSTWFELPLGVETQLPWDVKLVGSIGIHRRNVEASFKNDFTFFVADVALEKQLGKKTLARTGFYRHPEETTFENQILFDETAFYGEVQHQCTSKLLSRFGAAWGRRDFQEDSLLGPRFLVANTLFISQGDIRTRHDDFLDLKMGGDYHLASWWTLNAQYRFSHRGSNVDFFDANEHRVSVGSTFSF